ncbi:hypothetical protein PV326_009762 [Microctonus aethiopoides]|uniref:G-protein coupled receptors family 1 profile domain-containing protein n=1 Tax=Microctonus aethiopoides TaxID=144406 RepID=A0AA39C3S6_9HYME|nr:hypothetical protein PV326_009762 [Microctonus aethiopoides]KAK0157343.1 hypothetical protein PV328_011096 [Microctonus aethiopoides]
MTINTTSKKNGEIEVSKIAVCLMQANTTSTVAIFLLQNITFFVVPLIILSILYSMIVRELMNGSSSATGSTSASETYHTRTRKQVIMILLSVIFSFFICLAPFQILKFYIVLAPIEDIENIEYDIFYNILNFSRIMFYSNSAINPILYNLMSSRFRIGFLKLCGIKKHTIHNRNTLRSTLSSTRVPRRMINNSDQREHFFPIVPMTRYILEKDEIGVEMPACQTSASTTLPMTFFLTTIIVFFVLPLVILIILYTVIAKNLMANPTISRGPANNLLKYRKQVVMMLGTVVISFFICLLPFRAFTLWILVASPTSIIGLGIEGYFSLLYFCRVMFYLNSAVNPILYNLMSTKFRDGFLRLCGLSRKKRKATPNSDRTGTTNNNTTITHNSSSHRSSDFWRRSSSNRSCSVKVSSINVEKPFKLPIFSTVTGSINRKKDESYV